MQEQFNPDLTFLAYPPHQKKDKIYFEIVEKFLDLPDDLKEKFNGRNIMKLTWGKFMMYASMTQKEDHEKILYWDKYEEYYFIWKSKGSWHGKKGKFGNSSISNCSQKW